MTLFMDQSQIPQVVQQASQSSFYTKETDDLLKKYLKIQINMFYWGMVYRVLFFVFIVVSFIISITTILPMLEKLMGPLGTYQQLLQGNTTLPLQNNSGQSLDLNAIIEQLQGN